MAEKMTEREATAAAFTLADEIENDLGILKGTISTELDKIQTTIVDRLKTIAEGQPTDAAKHLNNIVNRAITNADLPGTIKTALGSGKTVKRGPTNGRRRGRKPKDATV
jgi:hypothetical protein